MTLKYEEDEEMLKIFLNKDIDTVECKKIKNLIDSYILKYQPREIQLDLKNVEFMDSSGIGLLMGRYNLAKMFDSKVTVCNPSDRIKKVMKLTDICKYIDIMEG